MPPIRHAGARCRQAACTRSCNCGCRQSLLLAFGVMPHGVLRLSQPVFSHLTFSSQAARPSEPGLKGRCCSTPKSEAIALFGLGSTRPLLLLVEAWSAIQVGVIFCQSSSSFWFQLLVLASKSSKALLWFQSFVTALLVVVAATSSSKLGISNAIKTP